MFMGFGSHDLESCMVICAHHLETFWTNFEKKNVVVISHMTLFEENLNNALGPGAELFMGFGSHDLESCIGICAHHLEAFWKNFKTKIFVVISHKMHFYRKSE